MLRRAASCRIAQLGRIQKCRYLSDNGKDIPGKGLISDSPFSEVTEQSIQKEREVTDESQNVLSHPDDMKVTLDLKALQAESKVGENSENAPNGPLFSRSTHVVESIGSAVNATKQQAVNYTHEINKAYAEVEHNMMLRINENNQRRFRLVSLTSILFIVWVVAVFGEKIRKMLSDSTAGLAKETLENESLKVQTQELAMAVVQTVLNDKEVTAHAASFLREASVVPETQLALLALTLHVLQHPDSLREFSILVKKLIAVVDTDKVPVSFRFQFNFLFSVLYIFFILFCAVREQCLCLPYTEHTSVYVHFCSFSYVSVVVTDQNFIAL